MRRIVSIAVVMASVLGLGSCGGSSSNNGGNPTPPSSVTVTPASPTINKGGMQSFSATVNGSTDQSVFWGIVEATPQSGDSTHGFISNAGVYVAPVAVPNPPTVTIQAAALADPTKTGSSKVMLQTGSTVSVSVTSTSSQVAPFGQLQFTAMVTGNANPAVTWQVNSVTGGGPQTGAISTSGLFTAPNSVPVLQSGNNAGQTSQVVITAISQADATAADSVLLDIVPPQQNAQGLNSPLGVSGGNANDKSGAGASTLCCGGTLGSLVTRGGNSYILSNNHVLARSDVAAQGEQIVQPGLIDNNCTAPPAVATLSQFFNMENGSGTKIDAALAQINPGAVDATGTILQLGSPNSPSGQPTNGAPHAGPVVAPTINRMVAKSGRSTGLTCSTIFATNMSAIVQYQKGCGTGSVFNATFINQVDIANSGFSAEGDSGSLVVTQDTADPVGLLFAGSPSDTLANPVSDVLNGLADPTNPSSKPVFQGTPGTHSVDACNLPKPQAAMGARLAMQRMTAPADALQHALAARDAHSAELTAHPEVQAVGVGASYDSPTEPAILFFVTRGQRRSNLPSQVDGVRTRIIEEDFFSRRGLLSIADSDALEQAAAVPQLVYPISDTEAARAQIVHAAHLDALMKQAGVQGAGIGSSADAPGEAALIIFLIKGEGHDPVPPVIDGLRTRIRESERFRAGVGQIPSRRGCSMPLGNKPQLASNASAKAKP